MKMVKDVNTNPLQMWNWWAVETREVDIDDIDNIKNVKPWFAEEQDQDYYHGDIDSVEVHVREISASSADML